VRRPKPHPLRHEPTTARQARWTNWADQLLREGRETTAALFYVFGQPTVQEKLEDRDGESSRR
jgi:hypothetical protein